MKKIHITPKGRIKIEEILFNNMAIGEKDTFFPMGVSLTQNMIVNMLESKRKQGEEFIEIL